MDSETTITTKVTVGGDEKNSRQFSDLSKSGKIVNTYNTMIMAGKPNPKKVKR